jgi:hypothetical protein
MDFLAFRQLFQQHVADLLEDEQALFVADVNGDELWEAYLDSFPPGTNDIYRERRVHDCSCCRHFVRQVGNVIAIKNNQIATIWSFETDETYQPVVDALDALVKVAPIRDVFVTKDGAFGTDSNYEQRDDGTVHTWHHFRVELPARFVTRSHKSEAALRSEARASHDVFKRSLEELASDATEIVLDLIAEKSLYRGEEWQGVLTKFAALQAEYRALPDEQKDAFCWSKSVETSGAISRIRNHSVGTLLQDITAGVDIMEAVGKYEHIVAPSNYKRPKAIFTKKMVEEAQATVERLGLLDSLGRRHARLDDITPNNALWSNKDAARHMRDGDASSVFEMLKKEVTVNPRQFERIPGVDVTEFIAHLSTATSIEALFENRHQGNLVSLIAPQVTDSPAMFKWSNGFSWAYNGNLADSMRERVKAAGGNVEGVLRFSLQWNEEFDNRNDFDAHCVEPGGNHIFFPNKGHRHLSSGMLDVDIIHPSPRQVAVENITWARLDRMPEGEYHLFVYNYAHRGGRSGFSAEVEFDGQIYEYRYSENIAHNESVTVAKVQYDKRDGFKITESLPSTMSSREVWNLTTNQFHPVSVIAYSPNYWDEQLGIGNRHYLFMLAGCQNPDQPNGFYNEYLRQDLLEHKRVFAALGNKMRVGQADYQLSGLGFSSTQRSSLIVKVDGKPVKIIF